MSEPAREVRIERTYAAPIEVVFDAWTSPEVMRRWLHPASDWGTPEAEVDLRVEEGCGSSCAGPTARKPKPAVSTP